MTQYSSFYFADILDKFILEALRIIATYIKNTLVILYLFFESL